MGDSAWTEQSTTESLIERELGALRFSQIKPMEKLLKRSGAKLLSVGLGQKH
jgi:hypothetical protein